MEYVAGGSLRELLDRSEPLSLARVLQIGLELVDALTQTHYQGIIHRDIKPANILLDERGRPRLTDFGVARLGQAERLTQTGAVIGTLDYLSPEALNGSEVDTRTDIWSLGVLFYELLALTRPFSGETLTEVLTAIGKSIRQVCTCGRPSVTREGSLRPCKDWGRWPLIKDDLRKRQR